MPKITFLPNPDYCPEGKTVDAPKGMSILDVALSHDIELEHACDKSCACTTCHIIVRKGFNSLASASEQEDDLLDKAWGLEPESRLGCQACVADDDLTVDIPKYTLNHAKEGN